MAYYFYLDGLLLPVTPGALDIKVGNNNKTVTLVNEGEMNRLKLPALAEFSFDFLLPSFNYPFCHPNTQPPQFYLEWIKRLKLLKKPFVFLVSRVKPNGDYMHSTTRTVVIEDYTIKEDADKHGFDFLVSIKLKEYRTYQAQPLDVKVDEKGKATATVKTNRPTTKEVPKTYTVKSGDTLWKIAKKELGNGDKYKELAKLNSISNPNKINVGQVIKLV